MLTCGTLQGELIALGVLAVCLPVWTALPAEQRGGLTRFTREAFELIHAARGHP